MAIDVKTRFSPGWWMQYLERKRADRALRLEKLDLWFRGQQTLPEGARNCAEAYREFQRKARTNFAQLVVVAVAERMTPTGIRTAATDDENGDVEARRIWERNSLDIQAADVHENMLSMGYGYVIVGGPPEGSTVPLITGEDPRQVIAVHDPARPRLARAGLKSYHDPELEEQVVYLYLPGRVHVARKASRQPAVWSASAFTWDPERGGVEGEEVDGDVVPVVEFRNRRGVGEFEEHVDLLGRIDYQILQRMVIATMQAFRQRAVKNMPTTDSNGNDIDYSDMFVADPGAVWLIPEDSELWESGVTDLAGILAAVKDDIRDLAAVTRTPLTYLNPESANQSAEGASVAREGATFKGEDRIVRASEGWKDVMSLAFQFAGDEQRADRDHLEVLWAPVQRVSLSERADAASKATDVPWNTKMTDIWQFTPADVARMEVERQTDAALAEAFAPVAPVAEAPPVEE